MPKLDFDPGKKQGTFAACCLLAECVSTPGCIICRICSLNVAKGLVLVSQRLSNTVRILDMDNYTGA